VTSLSPRWVVKYFASGFILSFHLVAPVQGLKASGQRLTTTFQYPTGCKILLFFNHNIRKKVGAQAVCTACALPDAV
jgi:hypothetical protein